MLTSETLPRLTFWLLVRLIWESVKEQVRR